MFDTLYYIDYVWSDDDLKNKEKKEKFEQIIYLVVWKENYPLVSQFVAIQNIWFWMSHPVVLMSLLEENFGQF